MIKPKSRLTRIILIIILALLALLSVTAFSSCKSGDDNLEIFSPGNGKYEIRLNPGDWMDMSAQLEYYGDRIGIYNETAGIVLVVDCYPKTDFSDINNFMEFYKTSDIAKLRYEATEDKIIGGATDVAQKEIKGTGVKSGKRQEIRLKINGENAVGEFIYLEANNYFLAFSYTVFEKNFADAHKAANEALANLKIK